jgi:voltage-gated potassium channel
VILILAASALAIIQTEPVVVQGRETIFAGLELTFGLVFVAEYLARLWTIAEDKGSGSALRRRLRLAFSPAALVDLAVILLTFLPFFTINPAIFRLARVLRILRLAKLGRLSRAFTHLSAAIRLRRYELAVTGGLALVVLIFGATALYWLEAGAQPDKFGSIPRALWWAVITLTTIGYGDVYPVTNAGKGVAALVALSGVGLIALPAGLLASAFTDVMKDKPIGEDAFRRNDVPSISESETTIAPPQGGRGAAGSTR